MSTPTEALHGLNKIKERHEFLKLEILKLLDEDIRITNQLNIYGEEVKELEENYVDLMSDLTTENG